MRGRSVEWDGPHARSCVFDCAKVRSPELADLAQRRVAHRWLPGRPSGRGEAPARQGPTGDQEFTPVVYSVLPGSNEITVKLAVVGGNTDFGVDSSERPTHALARYVGMLFSLPAALLAGKCVRKGRAPSVGDSAGAMANLSTSWALARRYTCLVSTGSLR